MPLMTPVNAAELAAMQAEAVAAVCDKACVVQRKSPRVPTAQGGNSATYETVETTVIGLSEPSAGTLQNYQYLVGALATWVGKMPVTTTTQELDQLLVDGEKLLVKKILKPRSIEILRTVLVVEVK